jgi:6-phosphogluconate dehydrogenase (decarboxylating)
MRAASAAIFCTTYDANALREIMGAPPNPVISSIDTFGSGGESSNNMIVRRAQASGLPYLLCRCESDDVVIDDDNSYYHEHIRRAAELKPKGIHSVNAGTSGGVWGEERGYCLMIGGEDAVIRRIDPNFSALAPVVDAAPRTPGREKTGGTAEHGRLHCRHSGAAHFARMVHNGIEYGIMASCAEGLNILRHANAGKDWRAVVAETTPLRRLELYLYDLNLAGIAEVWRRGSVIVSPPLDLDAISLLDSADLAKYAGRVSDSGRCTGQARPPPTSRCRPPCRVPLCTLTSVRAAKTTSPTSHYPHFNSSSAATKKKAAQK